ncbi:HAD family hydrolase [Paenibacillus sp. HJGM_3]|uniref:HAD family hydrolase n=1 Tax=Paenibacillus sp. HJGM_3 TaxID=3379816 RepID=UPI003858C8D2
MTMESPFPKLLITDLDGTALGGFRPYSRLPDPFSRFLERLDRHGCRWVTNTAWDSGPQVDLVLGSELSSLPAYISGGVGLDLCRLQGDRLEAVEPYTSAMHDRLRAAQEASFRPFIRDICARFDAAFIAFNGGVWFAFTPVEDQVEPLFRYVKEAYGAHPDLNIRLLPEEKRFHAHPAFLTKASIVDELARLERLSPAELIVAGDELPDLAMMDPKRVKYAICPGNAHPEVKERVRSMGGAVGTRSFGPGVIEAFCLLARAEGWSWDSAPLV